MDEEEACGEVWLYGILCCYVRTGKQGEDGVASQEDRGEGEHVGTQAEESQRREKEEEGAVGKRRVNDFLRLVML